MFENFFVIPWWSFYVLALVWFFYLSYQSLLVQETIGSASFYYSGILCLMSVTTARDVTDTCIRLWLQTSSHWSNLYLGNSWNSIYLLLIFCMIICYRYKNTCQPGMILWKAETLNPNLKTNSATSCLSSKVHQNNRILARHVGKVISLKWCLTGVSQSRVCSIFCLYLMLYLSCKNDYLIHIQVSCRELRSLPHKSEFFFNFLPCN